VCPLSLRVKLYWGEGKAVGSETFRTLGNCNVLGYEQTKDGQAVRRNTI
jgi:hypothetical protein